MYFVFGLVKILSLILEKLYTMGYSLNKDEILFLTKKPKPYELCKKAYSIGESVIKSVKIRCVVQPNLHIFDHYFKLILFKFI